MKKLIGISVAVLGIAACQDPAAPTQSAADVDLAVQSASSESEPIPGQYIVVFKAGVLDAPGLSRRLIATHGGTLRFTYGRALNGFAARLPDAAAAAIARSPLVAFVERDQKMYASTTQTGATWGLDRTDQRALPLTGSYGYANTGAGVTAYIIDTGIRFTHNEFGGRAVTGFDAVTANGTGEDCNGHGTHVAGTVGGATYGIAKGVQLVAVRVLDCAGSGSTAGVIAGIDWVTANHQSGIPAVANMSLGGGASTALDQAVRNSIADGVTFAIAAGNGFFGFAQNACNYSPARVADAITVGATNSSDAKASWSNYGNCVDFFAPGVSITSAWYSSDVASNTISGTSMATPHVTGVAALYLEGNPSASPVAVRNALFDNATKGVVTSSRTTNNHLLFSNY